MKPNCETCGEIYCVTGPVAIHWDECVVDGRHWVPKQKTPLEMALDREAEDWIDYCDECEYVAIIRGTGYCGISGKLLLPMMFDRKREGGGPARRCQKRKEAKANGIKRGGFIPPGAGGPAASAGEVEGGGAEKDQ